MSSPYLCLCVLTVCILSGYLLFVSVFINAFYDKVLRTEPGLCTCVCFSVKQKKEAASFTSLPKQVSTHMCMFVRVYVCVCVRM